MPELKVFLLGGYRVTVDDIPITAFESDKARALLAYLALETSKAVRREFLACLLWPALSQSQANHNLRQVLFSLRKILTLGGEKSDFFLATYQTVELLPGDSVWVDVVQFLQATRALKLCPNCIGNPQDCMNCLLSFEQAAELYQGRFLDGLVLQDCEEFNQWSWSQAEYLEQQAIRTLANLTRIHLGLNQPNRMLARASRWATIDPYDEAAHRAVIHARALKGQRGAALAYYEHIRQLLKDELGIEPARETQELRQRIMNDEVPALDQRINRTPLELLSGTYHSPYRGLAAFREQDAAVFFGRESFSHRLKAVVERHPVTLLVAASGAGKSSMVSAGLLPLFRQEGEFQALVFRPGNAPMAYLALSLQEVLGETAGKAGLSIDEPMPDLDGSYVRLALQHFGSLPAGKQNLLLICDQFEELFSLCPVEVERCQFIRVLLEGVQAAQNRAIHLLLVLRADFMNLALGLPGLADAVQEHILLLGAMDRDGLLEVITKPAALVEMRFERGLVTRLLDDVANQPGCLPLLEFAMTLLFEEAQYGLFTHEAYEKIGRVQGALARYAEHVYEGLDVQEKERARRIFLQLVVPGKMTECTRRTARRVEFDDAHWALTQRLASWRLVVIGLDPYGNEIIELVHEALIRGWQRLESWIRDGQEFRTWQEGLRNRLVEWQAFGHEEEALLQGVALASAEGWLEQRSHELAADEVDFIQSSLKYRQRCQSEIERRRRSLVGSLVFGLVVAVILILFAFVQRQEARRQASIGLAAQAESELYGSAPERSVLLALEALENYPYTWQAERALGKAILENRLRHRFVHGDTINSALWSSDGSRILTASSDGVVFLWDTNSGEVLRKLVEGAPTLASWSPDEKYILGTNAERNVLVLWESQTGTPLYSLGSSDLGGSLNITLESWQPWSPVGDRFLTQNLKGVLKIWDTRSGRLLRTLSSKQDGLIEPEPETSQIDVDDLTHLFNEIQDQALWSPRGDLIAASSQISNTVDVWHVETGVLLYTEPGNFDDQRVLLGGWAPSGDRFATRGLGGVKIFDAASGAVVSTLATPGVYVYRALWSADGSRMLTMGVNDGSARLWDTETGQQLFFITNLGSSIGLGWSVSENWIAVGDNDGVVHLWDLNRRLEVMKLYGSIPRILHIAFSPDGERFLVIGDDHVVNVYDLSEATLRIIFPGGPDSFISSAAWSPDGKQIAIAPRSILALKIWDVNSGIENLSLIGHDAAIWSVAWSSDGDYILSSGEDQTVQVWDARTGERKTVFRKHNDGTGAYWAPYANRIASHDSNKIMIWDAITGKLDLTFLGHQSGVVGLSWSPDGKRILSFSLSGEAIIWDSTTGQVVLSVYPQGSGLEFITGGWSREGRRILLQSGDGAIHIMDASNRKELSQFPTDQASWNVMALSPSDRRLLKGGFGGSRVYELGSGVELFYYPVPGFNDPKYSPDGSWILIGSNYGTLEIYPAWHTVQELIDYARKCCVLRLLTFEERQRFGLSVK